MTRRRKARNRKKPKNLPATQAPTTPTPTTPTPTTQTPTNKTTAITPATPTPTAIATAITRATAIAPTCHARPKPIIPLLNYQKEDIESNDRFRWNCWARQTGKSFTKSLRRIIRGLKRRRNQIFLSAGERQCKALMQKARQHCHALKIATRVLSRDKTRFQFKEKQMEIELPGGIRIIGLPANPHTARGYTGDVLLDEFAMHKDDREIWSAMFPTLLRGKGELDIASTPMGKESVFHDIQFNPRFTTSRVTLHEAVDAGLKVDIEEIRTAMGDEARFRREFLCEFADSDEAFIDYDRLLNCTTPHLNIARKPDEIKEEKEELFAGIDLARHHDTTVMWVLQKQTQRLTTIGLIELRQQTFANQFQQLRQLLERPNLRKCCIDATGLGMPLAEKAVEEFGPHRVEPITFTAASKAQIAHQLKYNIEQQLIEIPDDEKVIKDLHAIRRIVTAAGNVRLDAQRSNQSHADRFWAAALAVHGACTPAPHAEARIGTQLAFSRKGIW
ncbi:MAG: terminase large subunit domain-containing protein [Phycisphaerae bacterium]